MLYAFRHERLYKINGGTYLGEPVAFHIVRVINELIICMTESAHNILSRQFAPSIVYPPKLIE